MRVNKYDVILDTDRKPMLVKENSKNFMEANELSSPSSIVRLMELMFNAPYLPEEHVWILALNNRCKPMGIFEISHGIENGSYARGREIFMRLCLVGASKFVMMHNHPSGDITPSNVDYNSTKGIKQLGDLMGIPMVDHIIIGGNANTYYSMQESGWI